MWFLVYEINHGPCGSDRFIEDFDTQDQMDMYVTDLKEAENRNEGILTYYAFYSASKKKEWKRN